MSDILPHAFKFVNKFYNLSVINQLVNTFVSIPIRHSHFSLLNHFDVFCLNKFN